MTEEAAKESGLKKGTPVIVGTGDSTAEAISVGLVESGTVFFQYGSSMFYYYCVDRYVDDYVSANGNGSLKGGKEFTIPGTFCIGDGANAAGTLTRWVRDMFYEEELKKERAGGENAYAVMAREAAEVEAGSEGLIILPYIYGERSPIQDAKASGMLFGLKGTHTRKQINRAALEAVGYSTLQHMILFDEMNLPPKSVITAGGGTKNAAWMQIICDMIGRQYVFLKDISVRHTEMLQWRRLEIGGFVILRSLEILFRKGKYLFRMKRTIYITKNITRCSETCI